MDYKEYYILFGLFVKVNGEVEEDGKNDQFYQKKKKENQRESKKRKKKKTKVCWPNIIPLRSTMYIYKYQYLID